MATFMLGCGSGDADLTPVLPPMIEPSRPAATVAAHASLFDLDFSFEYGADRPKSAARYASVAFYYLFD